MVKGEARLTALQWALRWASLGFALWLLNLALTFHNVWPTLGVTNRNELSVESALLLVGLALHWRVLGPPSGRFLAALTILFTVLTLGRYADVTAPALYGRPLNVYWDSQHVPTVLMMLARSVPGWQVITVVAAVLALMVAIYGVLRWALGRLARGLEHHWERRVVAGVGGVLSLLYFAGLASPHLPTEYWYTLPVAPLYARQAGFVADALMERARADTLPPSPKIESDLATVQGADVLVVFLESYGATSYDNPNYAAALDPSRRGLSSAVTQSGRRVVSAFVEAPTFGGASWLSHASFLAGIEVADPASYELLLTQTRETLVQRFAQHGYRPIAVMPGLRQHWPEGAFYGFERIYDASGLGYRGPDFGFWRIPDQYAFAKLHQVELADSGRAPRLVFFPTISSHLPFHPTPPYQPDWDRLLGADPYDSVAHRSAMTLRPDLTPLGPAYVDVLRYDFQVLAGFLCRYPEADQVLIVLGDHQPAASVSGQGAVWEVPVHVISNRAPIIDRLLTAGFSEGLRPARPALGRMHELKGLLLRVFDSASPRSPESGSARAVL